MYCFINHDKISNEMWHIKQTNVGMHTHHMMCKRLSGITITPLIVGMHTHYMMCETLEWHNYTPVIVGMNTHYMM